MLIEEEKGLHKFRPKEFSTQIFGPKKVFFILKSTYSQSNIHFVSGRNSSLPRKILTGICSPEKYRRAVISRVKEFSGSF